MRAVVLGATGLVGSRLVALLSGDPDWTGVRVLVRRPLPEALRLPGVDAVEAPPDTWGADPSLLRGDALFIALGTTRRKAGSAAAFRAVDLELVTQVAVAGARVGVPRLLVVSSVGADPSSPFLYPRTKGEMEAAVSRLGVPSTVLLRPPLLLGARGEFRLGERAAALLLRPLSPLLRGPLDSLRPVHAEGVARAMVHLARKAPEGVSIVEPAAIRTLAELEGQRRG